MTDRFTIGDRDVFLVVDIQDDFCPGGSLAVPGGDEVVPLVNGLAGTFAHVVLTQDWHPRGHLSFASSHPGKKPYQTIELAYGTQVLWPDHCVQGTAGAAFRKDLKIPHAELVLRKGYHREMDSIRRSTKTIARRTPGLPDIWASAVSGGSSSPASRSIFACAIRRKMRVARVSRRS